MGTAGATTAAQWWERFFRYGPYGLLGLATAASAVSVELIMDRSDVYAAAALVPVVLVLQLWWGRYGPALPRVRGWHSSTTSPARHSPSD